MKRGLLAVPVDSSVDSDAAAEYAFAVSKQLDADVHFLVVQSHPRVIRATNDDVDDSDTSSRLESLLRTARARGVRAMAVIKDGRSVDVIPAYAQLEGATWIVVAESYGSRLLRRTAVVRTLARRSPCPVLVVPPDARPDAGTGAVFSEILSPVDFTVASALAMRSALRFARRAGSRVTVLHVLEGIPNQMVLSAGEALRVIAETKNLAADVTVRLRTLVQRESGFSQRVVTSVQTGLGDRTILDVAHDIKADLIVMGNARRGSFDRAVFGSTSRRVVNRARCPVLLVPSVAGAYDWGERSRVQADLPLEMAVS